MNFIPCEGDTWNDFDVEIKSDKVGVQDGVTTTSTQRCCHRRRGTGGAVGVSSGPAVLGGAS